MGNGARHLLVLSALTGLVGCSLIRDFDDFEVEADMDGGGRGQDGGVRNGDDVGFGVHTVAGSESDAVFVVLDARDGAFLQAPQLGSEGSERFTAIFLTDDGAIGLGRYSGTPQIAGFTLRVGPTFATRMVLP
jgi:hypothetical protein